AAFHGHTNSKAKERSAHYAEGGIRGKQIGGKVHSANGLLSAKHDAEHHVKNQRKRQRGYYIRRLAQGLQKLILRFRAIDVKCIPAWRIRDRGRTCDCSLACHAVISFWFG